MSNQEIVNEVLSKLKSIKGIRQVLILNDEDRKKIAELEALAEGEALMGLGISDNRGVKEVLKREVVVACVTEPVFEWPKVPIIVVEWKGKVIGEDIPDPAKREELKNNRSATFMGNIALYKERMPKPQEMIQERAKVVFSPLPCTQVENVLGACNAIIGSPTPHADNYQKTRMGIDLLNHKLGTVIIGFDIKK